ncbi:MAG: ATP-binding protein [Solirubrobacteraceae bacterium]
MIVARPRSSEPGQTSEVRGISVLRLALLPIALLTQSNHKGLSSSVFPWVIVGFGIYATISLLVSFASPRPPRMSLTPAVVDLIAVSLLVYSTGGEHSPLRFAFYVMPIGAALRLSPKLTATWGLASVIAYLAVTLPWPDNPLPRDPTQILDDSLSLLWVTGAAVMLSAMVGRRQRAIVEFAERRRELVQQALDAGANEQRRLAEALHDQAVQNVLLARQELTDIARGVAGAEQRARDALDETDRQLRHEIFAMHPLELQQVGLRSVLDSLATNAAHQSGFTATVTVASAAERSDHRDLIVATVRELVTNVVKHAGATHVDITVRSDDGLLRLVVADDGSGIGPGQLERALAEGHIGLAALRERVGSRSGRLAIATAPDTGTEIEVTLPE